MKPKYRIIFWTEHLPIFVPVSSWGYFDVANTSRFSIPYGCLYAHPDNYKEIKRRCFIGDTIGMTYEC